MTVLLDGPALAHHLGVRPERVRQWAHRHPDRLPVRGRDARGRSLFSIDDALDMATAMTTEGSAVTVTPNASGTRAS